MNNITMSNNNDNPLQHKRRKAAKSEASIGVGDGEAKTKSLFFLDEQEKSDLTRATTNSLTCPNEEHDDIRKRKTRAPKSTSVTSDHGTTTVDFGYDLNIATTSGPAEKGNNNDGPQRRLWVKNRSHDWWDKYNSADLPEDEFRKAFQMGKDTFELICNELTAAVAKENTMLRDAVPVRQRVAVCIWRLASGESLRLVSKRFGLGISTCHKLVLEVCLAIKDVLMPKYLQWPNHESMKAISKEFEEVSGIPNVVGSMYTTHIPIIAPKVNVAAYFNKRHTDRKQKTSYSVTVQGVVDPNGVFTDVCIGWPGSMSDDQILEKSALYQRANGGLLKGVWIVGGSGYPLMDWVLVPYNQPHLTWTQHAFNEKIVEVQKVSKDAFARLKGRWSCLQKRTEMKLQDLPVVLGACCVLHNICEMRSEEIEPELVIEVLDDEMVPDIALRSEYAMKARDMMAHNLLHHNHAGTSFL
ncbi:ALP1-like protein [Tanacetum coccineum]